MGKMMNFARKLLVYISLSTAAISLTFAQTAASDTSSEETNPKALSTITGRIVNADTNAPLRKACVHLLPVNEVFNFDPKNLPKTTTKSEMVDSLLDGSFTIKNVPPGEYFVLAEQLGFEFPLTAYFVKQVRGENMSDEARRKLLADIPRVVVQTGQNLHINIPLRRGGVITGQILYDDGSPASQIGVTVQIRNPKNEWKHLNTFFSTDSSTWVRTNDEGRFRLTGLPAGEFVLCAELTIDSYQYRSEGDATILYSKQDYNLTIYSDNKLRSSEATSFKLNQGETRTGEDLEIPLNKMHTVKGYLTAARDGHSLNNGAVSLLFADDRSKLTDATIGRTSNGFQFFFVPEGNYILQVTSAKDAEYKESRNKDVLAPSHWEAVTLKEYGTVEQPILVTNEQSDLNIAVPDVKKSVGSKQ